MLRMLRTLMMGILGVRGEGTHSGGRAEGVTQGPHVALWRVLGVTTLESTGGQSPGSTEPQAARRRHATWRPPGASPASLCLLWFAGSVLVSKAPGKSRAALCCGCSTGVWPHEGALSSHFLIPALVRKSVQVKTRCERGRPAPRNIALKNGGSN